MKNVSVALIYSKITLDTSFLQKMDFLADDLRNHPKIEFVEYKWFTKGDGSETDKVVYQAVEDHICTPDLLVVVATHESTELGIEIGIANQYSRNTLICFDAAMTHVSAIITGSGVNNPKLQTIHYSSDKDLFEKIIANLPVKI